MLAISYKGIKMEPPRVVPKKVKECGKTQLIQSMLCDFYRRRGRSVFAHIYIWSPSALVDSAWEPIIKMSRASWDRTTTRSSSSSTLRTSSE